MAIPERDTVYNNTTEREVYTRESNSTGWFVGIIVALALLAIGYLVFSANSGPATTNVDVTTPAPVVETTPMTPAPAIEPAPMTQAPAAEPAPVAPAAEPATPPAVDAAPATPAPATPAAPAAPVVN